MTPLISYLFRRAGLIWPTLILLAAMALMAAVSLLQVEGDVAEVLSGRSDAYADYAEFDARFAHPSEDEIILITADDLGDEATLVALENLVIELQFAPGVLAVLSIFSVPDLNGDGAPILSHHVIAALPALERLGHLLREAPLAGQMLSEDRTTTLITVLSDTSVSEAVRLDGVLAALETAPETLDAALVGMTELQRLISAALVDDQLILMPLSTLACVVLALFLFRSWRAALVCVAPGLLGTFWWFGTLAALGIPMTPLMAVVPTVLVVLALADSIHIYHAVGRHYQNGSLEHATITGFIEAMPAVLLTSLTTAAAFLCLLVVGSPTLSDVALMAPLGLVLTTLAVLLWLPAGMILAFRGAQGRPLPSLPFSNISRLAIATLGRARWIAPASILVLFVSVGVVAWGSAAGYRVMDHVPRGAAFRADLERVDAALPGSGLLYVVVDAVDPAVGQSDRDRARMTTALRALYGEQGDAPTAELPQSPATVRILAADGSSFAFPMSIPLNSDWQAVQAEAQDLAARLAAEGLADVSVITGYNMMSSVELPIVVAELRRAFYIAITVIFVLATILMRSLILATLSLVPNLMPILGVELWLLALGQPVTIVGAIALTVAFGIAVDDTVHFLNRLRLVTGPHGNVTQKALETTLRDTVPPILTTSAILVVGFVTTLVSQMPSVAIFGQLIAVAIFLAVLADLFLFPSLILWATRRKILK